MERDDVELIHSVLSGDKSAFSALVQKYQKSVHALAWRKIGDFHIAEEITQDTFLQAHKKLASLKNPKQFAGWLYVIADRCCKAWFRKKKLRTESLETTSIEILERAAYADYVCEQREDAAVEHRRKIVQKLMEKLPESERTVMVLYYLGEMNCAEISKFLGVSPNTVRSRLQRARERLKDKEHIIHETLGSVPLSPNLTENIMRRIDTIKQTSPTGGKPLLPFAALGASAILVILLMGASKQLITNFQQPYSLDAKSEHAIEIVDAPAVLDIQSKPELQERVGGANQSKNRNNGLTEGTKTVENNLTQDAMQWNLPENAKARLGKGRINEIQYSPDGTILAVATNIGIWFYDTRTHQEIALLTDHEDKVTNIIFSPEGRFFASGSEDGTIMLWNRSSGTQTILTIPMGSSPYINMAFSPDGNTIAIGNSRTISIWDTITGEQKSSVTSDLIDSNNFIRFLPDGETIVCVNWGGLISLWNMSTGKLEKSIADIDHTASVWGTALSPDGKRIAVGSGDVDGSIYIIDLNASELMFKLSGHSADVNCLIFSSDGKTLASASYVDETIRLWNANTGEHKRTLTGHTGDILGLAFSPDRKTIASGGGDGTIRLWDASTGNQQIEFMGHTDYAESVVFSPDGKTIACGFSDGYIRLWNVNTKKHIKTFKEPKDYVQSMMFTTDGNTLISGIGKNIYLWDVHTDKFRKIISGHLMDINSIALNADGNILASGSADNTIRLWNMITGEHTKTLIGHEHSIYGVTFSPDGKTLVTGSDDNTIRFWDVNTGKTKMILDALTVDEKDKGVMSVAYSPDGKILASGGMETIIIWDINTGKSKMTLSEHRHYVLCLSFSPDGKVLASGSTDTDIHLWDPHTGEFKNTFSGHTGSVSGIAFSPDGKTLVSSSNDGTVLLWEIDP